MQDSRTPDTLPTPPWVHINGISNFRTIGGLETGGGGGEEGGGGGLLLGGAKRRVRSDFVYRCGAPVGTGPETVSVLQRLKLRSFYDFRSERELVRMKMEPAEYAGVERVFCPVFQHRDGSPETNARRMADYGQEGGSEGFVRVYSEILDEGVDAYRQVFTHIRDRPGEPLAVHCTAGKDRTGVAVALMLSLVGVSDEDVAAEYNLTETGLREDIERWIPHMLRDGVYGADEAAVRRSLGARKENMVAALAMLHERWGGAHGYLTRALGFSEPDVEIIKENLLEPVETK